MGRASDRQLERLMRGPLRGPLLRRIFRELPLRLDRDRARESRVDFEFAIDGRRDGRVDRYRVYVADGGCRVLQGVEDPAPLAVQIGTAPFLRLIAGLANPMQLYMSGELRVRGDVTGATRLQTLFPIPPRSRS